MEIEKNYPLRKLNTFGLTVSSRYFVDLKSQDEAIRFLNSGMQLNERTLVLGGGSNILFTHDFEGLIIKVSIPGIYVVREDDHFYWVKAGAGVIWHDLVEACVKANFGGIENLSLIPGSVGAAPVQNIGAYGVELKDTFEALEAIDLENGEKQYFRKDECRFGYRDSIFKNELRDKYLITNVILRLHKEPVLNTAYGQIEKVLKETGREKFTIRDVSDAVIALRRSKLPDPHELGNAGSFFKNPVISHEFFAKIQMSYPKVPHYPEPDNKIKIPAAWLIEQCGFKGKKHKGAAVHTDQPLVLVNYAEATGSDIVELSELIREKVHEVFDILLEPEVRII